MFHLRPQARKMKDARTKFIRLFPVFQDGLVFEKPQLLKGNFIHHKIFSVVRLSRERVFLAVIDEIPPAPMPRFGQKNFLCVRVVFINPEIILAVAALEMSVPDVPPAERILAVFVENHGELAFNAQVRFCLSAERPAKKCIRLCCEARSV